MSVASHIHTTVAIPSARFAKPLAATRLAKVPRGLVLIICSSLSKQLSGTACRNHLSVQFGIGGQKWLNRKERHVPAGAGKIPAKHIGFDWLSRFRLGVRILQMGKISFTKIHCSNGRQHQCAQFRNFPNEGA